MLLRFLAEVDRLLARHCPLENAWSPSPERCRRRDEVDGASDRRGNPGELAYSSGKLSPQMK